MPKLSPTYREDDTTGLPPDIKAYLDLHFLTKLDNLTVSNPKVVVVFSGGNAVGKSALSRRIQQEFKALVLENDGIKSLLLKRDPALSRDELNALTWKYSMDLYERLDTFMPNGLIVRDGVIHWYYDKILPIFQKHHYKLFIIAYELSKEKRRELIQARGDKETVSAERLITIMPDHDIHLERFRHAYTPNIILTDDTVFDHDAVIRNLRQVLEKWR